MRVASEQTAMQSDDVEALLRRERRASLPLPRQIILYLDPFSFFKDASRGPWLVRERALSYNRAMRWILVPYIRRWVLITAGSFLGIAPAEALAAHTSAVIIPAAFAVGCCIALTVTAATVAVYFLLGLSRD
jgi:hypothetical protein